MLKKNFKDSEKKFLDPSLCPHLHQKLMESRGNTHPPSKFCGSLLSSFCVVMLTNQPTNQPTTYKLTNMGENMTIRNNETHKISLQLVPAGIKALQ